MRYQTYRFASWGGVMLVLLYSQGTLAEEVFFSEMPVVLSAARLSQPLRDAPGALTVIDRETIKRTGARDLADVLRWVPGFQVAQSTNGTNAPVAVYHGLWGGAPQSMQVLIDGRTLYSPLWYGGVNFNALPIILEDVERIEILRGSNSAAYGSNAVQGVINIITTDPSLVRGGAVSASAGNQGVRDVYARLGWGGEDFSQRLSVSRQYDDGLNWFYDFRQTLRVEWRGDWRLSNKDEVRLMAGGVKTRLGLGFPVTPGLVHNPERDGDFSEHHLQAEWTRQLAGGDALRVRYFHVKESMKDKFLQDTWVTNFFSPPATFKLAYNIEPRSTRNDFELQHTAHIGDTKRVVWGFGLRRDEVRSQFLFATADTMRVDTKRLFGHLEWRLAKSWLLNLGATWESESLSGKTFSPRAMLNYRASDEQTLRIGASRAHRTPSLIEQRANMQLNDPSLPLSPLPLSMLTKSDGGLKPERLDSLELGYLGEFRRLGLMVDVRAFDERLKDRVIGFNRSLPAACLACSLGLVNPYSYINGQNVRTRGIEYQLRWKTPWSSEIWFNQTFLRIKSGQVWGVPANVAVMVAEQAERSAARRTESIHWMQELPWDANLTVSYARTLGLQWSSVDPTAVVHRVDWRLAMPFKTAWGRGEVAWIARSATGSIQEFSNGTARREQQQTLDPRHWITLRLDF